MTPPTWPAVLLAIMAGSLIDLIWRRWRHVRHRLRTGRCLECGCPVEDVTTP